MATYKYDVSVISADINKLNTLASRNSTDLVIETQNIGSVIDKIHDLIPQLNALHTALNDLITTTATATQTTLNQMIQLDDDFVEITEEGDTIETIVVDIRENQ